MRRILVDSGPLIALFDSSDKYHKICVKFIKNNPHELLTSLASITEVMHLLDFSRYAQTDFMAWIIAGAITIEDIGHEELVRIKELITKHSDLPMDFADACLVCLGEKYNIDEVATIDSDFDVYRLNKTRTFRTVLK